MLDQFKKENIQVAFFDGIQVAGTDPHQIAAKEGLRISRYAEHLRPGELGCFFSHRRLWQSLVDSGDDAYVILEDDMIFEPGFKALVEEIMDPARRFDIVRLSSLYPAARRHQYGQLADGRVVFWAKRSPVGMGCYTITKSAARALLKSTRTVFGPVDFDIDRCWRHWQKVHLVYPVATRLMDVPTTITGRVDDADRHIDFHERWWRRGTKHLYRFCVTMQRLKEAVRYRRNSQ